MPLPSNVKFGPDIGALLQGFFGATKKYSKVGVLCDDNTRALCYDKVEDFLPRHEFFEILSGEEHKNLSTCQEIWSWMTGMPFDRHSLLINLGGGVIGDMGGFCAALYKRGIDFVNVPTTLLAMVDASVGGKLGVDFMMLKNHIGIFRDPVKVLISPEFLSTLPERELRSGYAEVVKHSLIRDANMWNRLVQRPFDQQHWPELIPHSIGVKGDIVTADPTESSLRKVLNFGHTVGHAVESFFLHQGHNKLLHGEAIAVGMVCEAWLSLKKSGLDQDAYQAIAKHLIETFGHVEMDDADVDEIAELCLQDKKNKSGNINASLLEAIGESQWDVALTLEEVQASLRHYLQLA